MKVYFELDAQEKRQERFLFATCILIVLTIITGVYLQEVRNREYAFMMPLLFFLGGFASLFYGINGLGKGNLIPKWTPAYIRSMLAFILRATSRSNAERTDALVRRILGGLALMGSGVLFCLGVLQTGDWKIW